MIEFVDTGQLLTVNKCRLHTWLGSLTKIEKSESVSDSQLPNYKGINSTIDIPCFSTMF